MRDEFSVVQCSHLNKSFESISNARALGMWSEIDASRATCSPTSTRMRIERQTPHMTVSCRRMRAPRRRFRRNQCPTRVHVKVTFIPTRATKRCIWGTRSAVRRYGMRVIPRFRSLRARSSRSRRCRRRQRRHGFHLHPRRRCPSVRRRTCGARSDPRTKAKMQRMMTPISRLESHIGAQIFRRVAFAWSVAVDGVNRCGAASRRREIDETNETKINEANEEEIDEKQH